MELSRQNIANMLGVKFDEKFKISQRLEETYRLNKMCGLQILNKKEQLFCSTSQETLYDLLNGSLTIVRESLTKKERRYIDRVIEPYVDSYESIKIKKLNETIEILVGNPNNEYSFSIILPDELYGKEAYKNLSGNWYTLKEMEVD